MALVASLFKITKDRQKAHKAVECAYSVFIEDGKKYLQLDTYGSQQRMHTGATSQTLQLEEKSARTLKKLLQEIFPD
jgi:hypothetical protein